MVTWNLSNWSMSTTTASHATNAGDYAIVSSSGQVLKTGAVDNAADLNLTGYATADGGFVLQWDSTVATSSGGISAAPPQYAQAYDANGAPTTGTISNTVSPLPANAFVQAPGGAVLSVLGNQVSYADGAQTFTTTLPGEATGQVTSAAGAALPNGAIALSWIDTAGDAWLDIYDPGAHALSAPVQIQTGASGQDYVMGLPDGNVVVSVYAGDSWRYEVFDGAGTQGGGWVAASTPIQQLVNDQTAVGYVGGSGTEQAYAITPPAPPPSNGPLQATGTPVTLSGASGWTSAAVLSNGELAIAGGPGASGVGTVTTYDASGTATGSATLQEFEGASPTLTALTGGFYEVSYANTTDFEVYGSNSQLAFWHNAWSPAGQAFTPLQDGDDLITTEGSNSVGLVAPGGAIDWVSIPPDAPSGVTPGVTALAGGGFALTYAGTTHFDVFNASGQPTGSGDLGASMSSFAAAATATSDGGFAEMWLSADGGQNGLPSSLDVQAFDAAGRATSGVLTLTQDLDPWHTQTKLVSNADGSITAFWSQGGQVWSSQITDGAAGAAQATGVTGSLSGADMVALSSGKAGFAFLAYGDAWAEIWDPTTGTRTVAELGAATGDGSSLHAVATADGGFAVSWRDGAAIEASLMSASGQAGAAMTLPGDLLGVNASGQAVTVYDNGQGTPVMQTYTLAGGSFWRG